MDFVVKKAGRSLLEHLLHILVADGSDPVLGEDFDRFIIVLDTQDHERAVRFFGKECVGVF